MFATATDTMETKTTISAFMKISTTNVPTIATTTTNPFDPPHTTSTPTNMTDEEIRQYLQHLQDQEFKLYIPVTIFLITLAATGLVGNVLVLLVYRSKHTKSSTRIFIMAIATFDLVSNVLCIPGRVYENFNLWNNVTPALCRLLRYLNTFTTITAACILLAVAVARYRKICRPFGWQVSMKQAKIISVSIAIFGMSAAIPYCILIGTQSRKTPRPGIVGHKCFIDDTYINTIWPLVNYGFFLIIFLSLCIPLIILYTLIGVKAYRHSRFHGIPAISNETSYTVTTTMDDEYAKEQTNRLHELARKESNQCYFSENRVEESTEKKSGPHCSASDTGRNYDNRGQIGNTPMNTNKATSDSKMVNQIRFHLDGIEKERYDSCCSSDDSCTGGNEMSYDHTPNDTISCTGGIEVSYGHNPDETTGKLKAGASNAKHDMTPTKKRSREENKTRGGGNNRTNDPKRRPQRRMMSRTTCMLFIITLVFILCFIPYLTLAFYRFTQPENFRAMGTATLTVHHLFVRSYFLNSAVNPIIYSLCDVNFRRDALRVVMCCRHHT